MPSILFSVVFLFLTNFFIEPTTCAIPAYIQNLELDDITSIVDKFPAILTKIKEAVNRFRCPKGWRRLGGSCYYLSDVKSIAVHANDTCNLLHSNHSNLMQIRNSIELFYAAHILTKNNLSSLIIEIDPDLLKGKTITDILMNDQGRWQRMKDKFRQMRIRYYKLKEKILHELDSAGLRISRRSKKMKKKVKIYQEKYVHDPNASDNDYYDYEEQNITISTTSNDTQSIDEYEYDDLDSEDDADEFEQFDDVGGICDQVDWNVLNNDSTVYVLTTYLIANKIVCSLSNIEHNVEYDHVCEYVLDFCFANIMCGTHGRCVNTLSGFKCSCSFLYGGLICERISRQGYHIIVGAFLVILLYGLSLKPIRWTLKLIFTTTMGYCKSRPKKRKSRESEDDIDDKKVLVPTITKEDVDEENPNNEEKQEQEQENLDERRQSIAEQIWDFIAPKTLDPLKNPTKRDLVRTIWVSGLAIFFLLLLYFSTTLIHFSWFKYDITDDTKLESLVNETIRLVSHCERISNSRQGNLVFFPIALTLIIMFSWSVKRERRCLKLCDGRPGMIPPIEPFRTSNRFTTATVFGILAFEVLKIFEELLFTSMDAFTGGILFELIERIAVVVLVGVRYYPVLASLQLRNVVSRFFIALYILGDIVYSIVREGSCMGFLPSSRYYSTIEEAKLRMELGSWFIVYGLIKTSPHFIFLSYIGAELCVRFGYDSLYVPIKKNLSIWIAPVVQQDELEFSTYYVKKLFRKNLKAKQKEHQRMTALAKRKGDVVTDRQTEEEMKRSPLKKFFDEHIYRWDEDFRFTTIATCTYTVAIVFLYYVACTFVFLYISRTTGHISFIRYYLESTLDVEFKGFFSLRAEIIWSAVLAFILYGFQLFLGMQNYKKHKMELFRGIFDDVPSPSNFKANSIVSKSVHYSGFLVGYMAWGFLITFHLILVILSFIRIISFQMRYVELILAVTVPVTVVYLLKMVGASTAGTLCFMQLDDEKVNLDNRKTYAIFLYFNFFADCFLGVASCIIRFVKATGLNLIYMARLDCSFLGRPIERFDLGYAAYVSYLHMEVAHTNPIMLAFCYTLYDDVVKRRDKHCYDDECCIAPGELDDNNSDIQQISAKEKNPNVNETSSDKKKISRQESVSSKKSIKEKQPSIPIDDNRHSVREVKSKSKSPNPSIVSDKSSQKSKTRKLSIDNNINEEEEEEEEEEDGGSRAPTIATISRLIPEKQPNLPKPSAPFPDVPPRQDRPTKDDDDDDDDDDGGLKPLSISTISTIIPKKVPHLMPIQGKPPPIIPKRDDIVEDEEDDDGGINAKFIAQQQQELEEKKKKKELEKAKKKSVIRDDNEDDDGGIDPRIIANQKRELEEKKKKKELEKAKKQSAILDDNEDDDGGIRKTKPTSKTKPKKNSIKPIILDDEDEDEDGGTSKRKQQAAEKKKKELEAKKKIQEQKKALKHQDTDNDDDGALKIKQSTKMRKVSKPEISKDDDVDEDGGRIVKTFDTIKTIMLPSRPVLGNQQTKQPSPEALEDGSMLTSRRQVQPILASSDTVGRMVAKFSTDNRKIAEDNRYDTIPTDEERARRAQPVYSSSSKIATSNSNYSAVIRTKSYREAQPSTPPITQLQSAGSPSKRSGSNATEDSSHYSEITDETASSGIINHSYSGSIRSSSIHSIKQQSRFSSEKALKEQKAEESSVTAEDDEEDEDEKEEEEEQPLPPKQKPLRETLTNQSTAFSTNGNLADPNQTKAAAKKEAEKKKRACFRWHLAYTIINNYHLFDLRKHAESRLALLRIQRSNASDEAQNAAGAPAAEPLVTTQVSRHRGARSADTTPRVFIANSPASPEPRPPAGRRLISVPGPPAGDSFPQSPAERYIAIRSCMLYDVKASQGMGPQSLVTRNVNPNNMGARSQYLSADMANELNMNRPSYQRQASHCSSSTVTTVFNNTPNFQAIPESSPAAPDYQLANDPLTMNGSTLRSQMNYAQHMQALRRKQVKKFQKKRPYCYVYGPPVQQPMEEKVSTAAILSPQILSSTDRSRFQFPSNAKNNDGKQNKSNEPTIRTASSSHNGETNRNKSINNKPVQTKVTLTARRDSQSSFSNVTEV
ncbi:unnamed protein product [Rotaria socialis]|uniref:Receptor for retinol uptake STRA6 n=2 Tax=Rotaria socialis TaxID=392032 RepID=A0A817TLT6_9BILA|nr:unnamed protein product [Rotaria socialis]